jgi:TRAP transporter TAXI family solute receptor
MSIIDRRQVVAGFAGTLLAPALATKAAAQGAALTLMTAGQGSAFLPYGQGLVRAIVANGGPAMAVKESKGSNENLSAVDADAAVLGTAFLGSAFDAIKGTGFANGRAHANVRALFPMYETAFMAAALRKSGLADITSLNGKKVGCGPAAGPAEGYFRAAAAIAGINPVIVSGTPADQGKQLLAGEIDAFWQGAVVPIPSLVSVTDAADCVVFGLSDAETAAMRARFPFMAEARAAAGLYKGQTSQIKSVAAWNVIVAHKDLPDEVAYRLTKAALTAPDLVQQAGSAAGSTKATHAGVNTVLAYHPGAVRALRELGANVN